MSFTNLYKSLQVFILMLTLVACVSEQGDDLIDVGTSGDPELVASAESGEAVSEGETQELDKTTLTRADFSHLDIAANNSEYDVILIFGSSLLLNSVEPDFDSAPSDNLFYTGENPTNIYKMTRYVQNIAGEQSSIISKLNLTKKTIFIPVVYTESFADVIDTFSYSWTNLKYAIPQWLIDNGVEVDALITCFGQDDTNHLNDSYEDFVTYRWDSYASDISHLCEKATTPEEAAAEIELLLN